MLLFCQCYQFRCYFMHRLHTSYLLANCFHSPCSSSSHLTIPSYFDPSKGEKGKKLQVWCVHPILLKLLQHCSPIWRDYQRHVNGYTEHELLTLIAGPWIACCIITRSGKKIPKIIFVTDANFALITIDNHGHNTTSAGPLFFVW